MYSKESVLPFTDSGVVVVGNGSGYAQVGDRGKVKRCRGSK